MVFSWLLPSRIYGFHSNNGTRLLYFKTQNVFCLQRAFNDPLGHFFVIQNTALITTLQEYVKLIKRILSQVHFMDTEQLSKMQISLQVFLKDSVDRFGTTYLQNGFFWICVLKILLIDFLIANDLKMDRLKSILERFCS